MTTLSEKDKNLASLALFSSLYDTHRNVRDVLIDFIKMSIMEHGQLILRSTEIQGFLKEDFGFDNIPIAVIERAMGKAPFLENNKFEKGAFNVKSDKLVNDSETYKSQVESAKDEIDNVINALREHLIIKEFPNASKIPDIHLQRALSVFLIESSHNSQLSTLIHQFVITHREFSQILQKINNGAIIFMGLSYTSKGTEYTTLKEPLKIYLDTEILFHGAGYDGPTFETLFKEFIDTVYKINTRHYKKGGKLIQLCYFPEIKKEVDDYFDIAEKIINGKSRLDHSRNAMTYIVSKAQTPSDVKRMKAKFWAEISNNDIREETYDKYYEVKNRDYNIESEEFIGQLKVKGYKKTEDANNNLSYLNYVNILRRNRDQKKFSNIGYLFVTQTAQVLKLSSIIQQATNPDNFPLAISLSQITARLWLDLNQGFNPSTTLLSMDVIVKAQIGLASKIKTCLEKKHKDLQNEHTNSSPEQIASEIAALRVYLPNNPEDLTPSTEVVQNVNVLEKFIDDKILEVQQKDEVIREKDASLEAMQRQHEEDLKQKEKENETLRRLIKDNIIKEHKKAILDRKRQLNEFIIKSNKRFFWELAALACLSLASLIASIIFFIVEHKNIGCILLIFGLLGIIADCIKSRDIQFGFIKICHSRNYRKKRLRTQLSEFQKNNPSPNLKGLLEKSLKNN